MPCPDFGTSFDELESSGFTIHDANYSGDAFGCWSLEFSRKGLRRHILAWDGKERWLTLSRQRPERERTGVVPPERLRNMNYVDGVLAYHDNERAAWQEFWVGREEADWSVKRALVELT